MNGYIRCGRSVAAVLLGCLGLAVSAQAASFDCGKAQTRVEHLICDNTEISKLDEELAQSYKAAQQDQSKAGQIKKEQKLWVKMRNGCPDADCVKMAYRNRLEQLRPSQAVAAQAQTDAALPQAQSGASSETACIAPKIDWRNYEWTIITGKGEAICKEMLAYLKSRPSDIAPPTCPEERLPKNGNWTRPEIRILSEAERQHILANVPERFRQQPKGPVSYERKIRESKLLRVVKGDISGDGVPESLLAIGGDSDMQGICRRSKRCARPEKTFEGGIVLFSDSYELLPMKDEEADVAWSHRLMISAPFLWLGELVYYKNAPYWLSEVSWSQNIEDNFTRTRSRPDDPYSKMFSLDKVYTYSVTTAGSKNFKDATGATSLISDPGDMRLCRIGYFHKDNLKQNSIRKGK